MIVSAGPAAGRSQRASFMKLPNLDPKKHPKQPPQNAKKTLENLDMPDLKNLQGMMATLNKGK